MKRTKIFFDTEFTGLHQHTTLISIGLIAEDGKSFYAEFTDYDRSQVDRWVSENVIKRLTLYNDPDFVNLKLESAHQNDAIKVLGDARVVKKWLRDWLRQFESIEMWSDCMHYDWVLFCQMFGGAFQVPRNVHYIPFDICTLFKTKGVDPDIDREHFALGEHYDEMPKHNALWDAEVIMKCYTKLSKMPFAENV